jgi:hypothetical protein
VQAWSGLARLKGRIEEFKPELRTFRDEGGDELLDLPDAPARFLPEYDNLVLSHAGRTRFVPDEHRKKVFLSAGRATFLLDGTVGGTWTIEKRRGAASLVVEPFDPCRNRNATLSSMKASGWSASSRKRRVRSRSASRSSYRVCSINLCAAGRFSSKVGCISRAGRIKPPRSTESGRSSIVNDGMPYSP